MINKGYKVTKPSGHPTTICYEHRPQHFKVTVRLFTAEGHHRFLWLKAKTFKDFILGHNPNASKTNLTWELRWLGQGREKGERGGGWAFQHLLHLLTIIRYCQLPDV